jgi:hypothetical protein
MTHTQALEIAVAAIPDKDPKDLSACINADGTVSTYTWPKVPEWLTISGVKLRNRIAQAIKDASLSFTQQCEDTGRLAETDNGVLVRTCRKGQFSVTVIDKGRTVLYKGPNVSEAIFAWYSALGVKVLVVYHRGDTLYPVPEPETTCLWMVPTTREVSKSSNAIACGHVLGIEGNHYQVIEQLNV